jgi:hypothetical protein
MTSNLMRSKQIEKRHGWSFQWERLALASGILFVAVQIATLAFNVVFFLTTHPPMGASPQETARGFAEHATMVEIGTYLYVLHLPFLPSSSAASSVCCAGRREIAELSPSPSSARV